MPTLTTIICSSTFLFPIGFNSHTSSAATTSKGVFSCRHLVSRVVVDSESCRDRDGIKKQRTGRKRNAGKWRGGQGLKETREGRWSQVFLRNWWRRNELVTSSCSWIETHLFRTVASSSDPVPTTPSPLSGDDLSFPRPAGCSIRNLI